MKPKKLQNSVLIVSSSDKIYDYIYELLPKGDFYPVLRASSAGEAKRMLVSDSVDIVIINTPLPDEFGSDLALDLTESCSGIMLLVKTDFYEQICYKVEDEGIFTLIKPNSRQIIYNSIKLLSAMTLKIKKMEKRNKTLQEKMADIRVVNRAKWLLIDNLNMSEKEAHYYIEKQAMDTRLSRKEVAENIIRTYDK